MFENFCTDIIQTMKCLALESLTSVVKQNIPKITEQQIEF